MTCLLHQKYPRVTSLITGKVGVSGVAGAFEELGSPERHAKIIVEPWRD